MAKKKRTHLDSRPQQAGPQDHQPKKAKLTTGKFRLAPNLEEREVEGWDLDYEGLTLFLPRESFEDAHFQEIMAQMRAGGADGGWRYPLAIERMFGIEQKARLLEHITDPATGRASQERMGDVLKAALKAVNPNG